VIILTASRQIDTPSEPGAPPSQGVIPLCVPEIRGNEWAYVKECLDTNWISSAGPFVSRFEEELAAFVGSEFAVTAVNGTAALHIALVVAGVQPDDEVLVSALSFIAPANAIRYAGAWPVFMDAEPEYWQMDPGKVAEFLGRECSWHHGTLRNRATHRRVRAVMPVHVLGHPVDMDPILDVAREYELAVIEDATESLGAEYKGRAVGTLGHISCFSFNGNKLISTGGGGMIVTDNQGWAQQAKYLTTQAKDDPIEYIHKTIGYNYRLSNLQAALGCAQLESIDAYIAAKRRTATEYASMLSSTDGITTTPEADWAKSVFWMYTILVDQQQFGIGSRELRRALGDAGIQTRPLWQPLSLSRAHRGAQSYHVETAPEIQAQSLSLPSSVGLSDVDRRRVVQEILSLSQHAD